MGQGDKEELTEELSAIRQDLSEQDEEHVRRAEALKDSIAAYEKASRSSTKSPWSGARGYRSGAV